MNIKKKLVQERHFWSSILFGPDRKLSNIEKKANIRLIVDKVLLKVKESFPIPVDRWKQIKVAKNPHSEIFIFCQNDYPDFPKKIFIKRFIVQLETKNEIFLKGLKSECDALKTISLLNGKYNVCIPKLFAYDEELCLMVTSYMEGAKYFNVLLQSPIDVIIGAYRLNDVKKSLFNIGKWLKLLHHVNPEIMDRKTKLKAILDRDISRMKIRVEFLKNKMPADFTLGICEKIIKRSLEFSAQVLSDNITPKMTHGDLSLVNMLYDNGKIAIYDFANFGFGIPEDDIARLYLDLKNVENYVFMFYPKKKGALTYSFLSSYGDSIDLFSCATGQFHLLKHSLINIYMYTKHWGNRQFLNPFLARLFYQYQKKILFKML